MSPGGGDRPMVPKAEFESYYGRPIVRPPVWTHDIAIYLFTGGLAAGSAILAAGGQATGDPVLRRAGRAVTMAALGASTFFLIKDLGRPERFHHMLRVIKPTSAMSLGTWLLSGFGGVAGVAAASEFAPLLPERGPLGLVRRVLPPVGAVAGYGTAALAPGLATYTAVLFSDTAVPSWNAVYPDLPFVFAGSALASGAAVGLVAGPNDRVVQMAVIGAALELGAGHRCEHGYGLLSEPYRKGRAGKLLKAAKVLNAVGAVGAVVGRRSRVVSALAGAALLAGSVLTRFGVFEAGVESAKDPRYTVVPQREQANGKKVNFPSA
ncbi:NrfD/PsrC family molybdoenzyme membrane anchor subunit [Actinoplanes solisilvae]|uniref:NrfD/PsrC family molybdoenzyme membrane anchor subunit n=1 Tax=Actinoplanes solisilvae TaxID=2486853 RepID=UPI000FD7BBA0|nr:NrfD/PsrC family molybdoenzyme membrane anchor subunit [Actinoplanes solisilvae]